MIRYMHMTYTSLLGEVTISNDGATIMKLLDIVHPAAKTLVDIARSQDAEVSDPTKEKQVKKETYDMTLGWRWYYKCCIVGWRIVEGSQGIY